MDFKTMRKKFFLKTAIIAMISVLYGADASNNSNGPAFDENVVDANAVVAARAANAVYNITSESDTSHTPTGWTIIKFQKADANSHIQAVALKNGKKVIISYRGTTCLQDWMANLGIGYAQACTIKNRPIIEHLIESFAPCMDYHGLTRAEAITESFGADIGNVLSHALGWTASFVTPLHSAYIGGKNAVAGIQDVSAKGYEAVKEKTGLSDSALKKSSWVLGGAALLAAPFEAMLAALGTGGVVLGNAGRELISTARDVTSDRLENGGWFTNAAPQKRLIFNISRQNGHPYITVTHT